MSTNVPNLKQIGGGHRKTLVDLTWNGSHGKPKEYESIGDEQEGACQSKEEDSHTNDI